MSTTYISIRAVKNHFSGGVNRRSMEFGIYDS